jgi:hypothetical protein
MIAPDPRDPDIVYGGGVDRLDLRTEQTHSVDPTLGEPDDLYRRTWSLPLTFSKVDPKVLYYANQKMFRTSDGGQHWTTISPDLTREDPAVPANLDAITTANNLGTGPRRGVISRNPVEDPLGGEAVPRLAAVDLVDERECASSIGMHRSSLK